MSNFLGINNPNPAAALDVKGSASISSNLIVGNFIGINKSNPQYALDVNGNINFTGSLYSNGTILT